MAESAQFAFDRPPRRKVWVLNRHVNKEYKEEYRGEVVTVPPANEKKLLLDLVSAEKFLSRGATPQFFANDGVTELSIGKPLYIQELTVEEVMKYDPKNAAELKKEERELKALCTICGEQLPTPKGLATHITRKHPDLSPVKDIDAITSS